MIKLRKILCPVDFSEHSQHAIAYAGELARQFQAELTLAHVLEPIHIPREYNLVSGPFVGYEPAVLERVRERLDALTAELAGTVASLHSVVLEGSAFAEIVKYAKTDKTDLIVIATHGHTGVAHLLLGSTAEKVVRKAPCPVLTVKHPEHEFVTP